VPGTLEGDSGADVEVPGLGRPTGVKSGRATNAGLAFSPAVCLDLSYCDPFWTTSQLL